MVGDIYSQNIGQSKLSLILNENAGIEDDVVFSNFGTHHNIVINAGNKENDYKRAVNLQQSEFGNKDLQLEYVEDETLISIQGPKAKLIIENLINQDVSKLAFMTCTKATATKFNKEIVVSRCGYTGEDGFELSVPDSIIEDLVEYIFSEHSYLKPAGLGARDLLRLEAGMNLHGHDITPQISPVEALLMWTTRKSNQVHDFIGKTRLLEIKKEGVAKKKICIKMEGKGIPREGYLIKDKEGNEIGKLTSGTHSTTLKQGIGMGYVSTDFIKSKQSSLDIDIRGKSYAAKVVKAPFVETQYYRVD